MGNFLATSQSPNSPIVLPCQHIVLYNEPICACTHTHTHTHTHTCTYQYDLINTVNHCNIHKSYAGWFKEYSHVHSSPHGAPNNTVYFYECYEFPGHYIRWHGVDQSFAAVDCEVVNNVTMVTHVANCWYPF